MMADAVLLSLVALLLPAASFLEKDGTFVNFDRRFQRVRPALEPPGEAKPDFEIAVMMKRSVLGISDAEAAAYDAPFPDRRYRAGVRRFPALVPVTPGMEGVDVSLKSAQFLREQWNGRTFMAIGMQDPVLGPPVMQSLAQTIRTHPVPLELPEAGHFVQEHGQHARRQHRRLDLEAAHERGELSRVEPPHEHDRRAGDTIRLDAAEDVQAGIADAVAVAVDEGEAQDGARLEAQGDAGGDLEHRVDAALPAPAPHLRSGAPASQRSARAAVSDREGSAR